MSDENETLTDESKLPESVLLKRDLYTFLLIGLLITCATGLLAALIVYAPTMR